MEVRITFFVETTPPELHSFTVVLLVASLPTDRLVLGREETRGELQYSVDEE